MDAITTFLTTLWHWLAASWEWLLSEKGKDITGVLSNLATIILFVAPVAAWLFFRSRRTKRQPTTIDPKANADILKRNRQRMLEKVRHMWVEGVLEKSLYRVARLDLGYKESPEMVEHSWNLVVEQPGRQSEPIRAGTSMIDLFDRFDKTLLILGAPGSGKTTLLLELARDLIERAKNESSLPIPIIFNLSSWALQRPPIADWLIEELRKRYDVPEKIARFWIENEAILPLLDGLDEVAKEHRNACVEAINAYRENNGLLPIAICSRIADYETLTTKLHVQHAVTVQPLTPEQVDRYLAEAGDSLEPVRKLVKDDATLMELLDNPLMLSIMQLAFWNNADAATTLENGSIEKRRGKLFDTYIAAMFKRRKTSAPYKPEQTRRWLSRLGKSMIQREQTVFYIEQLQPDVLSKKQILIFTIFCFTISMVLGGLAMSVVNRMIIWLLVGIGSGLIGVFLSWIISDSINNNISLAEGTIDISNFLKNKKITKELISTLSFSLFFTLAYVLVFGFFIGPAISLIFRINNSSNEWLSTGIYVGLFFILILMLIHFIEKDKYSIFRKRSEYAIPNTGVIRSLKAAFFFGLLYGGLSAGLFVTLLVSFRYGLSAGLFIGLSFAVVAGMIIGLPFGGYAVIQHYVLRFLLWREGFAPLRYVRFLDHAADLLFLRKVGGGYIFVHRMIMEHFAAMEDGESAA